MNKFNLFILISALFLVVIFKYFKSSDQIVNPPPITPIEPGKYYWTAKGEHSKQWDEFVLEALLDAPTLISGSRDIKEFCPSWDKQDGESRKKVIIQLISAMAYFESGLRLNDRMKESSSENDPVTKQPVYSEGLLQLSYQDELNYNNKVPKQYCKFNWEADKKLNPTDKSKSIFDPKTNLQCGLMILERQVLTKGLIGYDKSYWSVLRPSRTKLPRIKEIVSSFSVCRY